MQQRFSSLIRLITASSLGTILEWYDFSLFAYLSPILARHFFPHENALLALMLTYVVFAVGYLVRPLGSMIFGHFGDRWGRKKTLVWSILLMSLPTFLMGVLPTYASIGMAAPLLLVFLRILQGLSAGGESTGAILFVLESVPKERRGLMGSLIWAMVGIGMLLGSLASTLVSHAEGVSWAWRVPFLFGILTGVLGFFLRRRTMESLMFSEVLRKKTQQKLPLWIGWVHYKKSMGIITGLYVLSAMITYLVFVFMPTYTGRIIGFPLGVASSVSTWAFFIVTLLVPIAGYVSDRIDRKSCLKWSTLGFVLLSYPLFSWMASGTLSGLIGAQIIFLLLAAGFQGVLNAVVFELVPTSVRYSVIAVSYNVSYSLFGGTAPFVATFLVNETGNKAAPGWYLVAGAMIALVAISKIKTASLSNELMDNELAPEVLHLT